MAIVFEFEDGATVTVERPADIDLLMPTAYEWAEDGDQGLVTVRDTTTGDVVTELLYSDSGAMALDWEGLREALLEVIDEYYVDDEDWYEAA